MESKLEVEKVFESLACDFANGTLADVGEDSVEEFTGECCADTCGAILIKERRKSF